MFLEKIRRWMYGRYGGDSLMIGLLVLGLLISVVARVVNFWPLVFAYYALYIWAIFRMLSRNIPARQREDAAFRRIWEPAWREIGYLRTVFRDRKTYKYFRCPNCKQRLRAPRGRGKILVTCQRCGKAFNQKT